LGVFTGAVTFASPDGTRSVDIEAVIDTGAEYSLIGQDLADRLGAIDLGNDEVVLAEGTVHTVKLAGVRLEMQGRVRVLTLWVGPAGVEALIGANCLAAFSFGVDPQGEQLIPQVPRLLAFTNWPTW